MPYGTKRTFLDTEACRIKPRQMVNLRCLIQLAGRHRSMPPAPEGFTLAELMIVVSVIGILSAIALPQFAKARARAFAGVAVRQAIIAAKGCAIANATGFSTTGRDGSGSVVTCGGTTTVSIKSRTFDSGADGIRCLSATSSFESTQATITVEASGSMTCAFNR